MKAAITYTHARARAHTHTHTHIHTHARARTRTHGRTHACSLTIFMNTHLADVNAMVGGYLRSPPPHSLAGSKTLVHLFETSPWLLPPSQSQRRFGSCPISAPHTGWIGERTSTCAQKVKAALSKQSSYRCAVDGHCALDTLLGGLPRGVELGRGPSGVRLVVLLRDPVNRVVSEFRHVCGHGE